MTNQAWKELHKNYYKDADWINKPNLFAFDSIKYFPTAGKILELGAGQGQDTRFFAEHGYNVVSTDLEDAALELNRSKLPDEVKSKVDIQKLDLRNDFPFDTNSFDVVYAHLSLHYFDIETTYKILNQITRVLKPGGTFAFFVNSTNDPEYNTGKKIEIDYFQIDKLAKRYFSVASTRKLVSDFFEINLLDNLGETYKDAAKGIHNLIRFVGTKPKGLNDKYTVPCVGAILERENNGVTEVFVQTRWKPGGDPQYSGTLEFPIGRLDSPYENIFDTLAHEIKSETGLTLQNVRGDEKTEIVSPNDDAAFGFKPFCCVQQLKSGKPWVGFIFICEIKPGVKPKAQLSESKDPKWIPVTELRTLFEKSPDKFFTLQLPAWEYYFKQND